MVYHDHIMPAHALDTYVTRPSAYVLFTVPKQDSYLAWGECKLSAMFNCRLIWNTATHSCFLKTYQQAKRVNILSNYETVDVLC